MTEKSNTTRKILAMFLAFFIVLLVIKFMLIHSETLSLDPGSRTNETMYKWQHSLVLKSLFIFTFFITLLLCGVELFKQKIISGKDYIQILFFSSITFLIAFINFNYKSMNYIQMFSLGNIDLDQLTSVWIHYLFFDKPFLGYYAITSIILLIILFLNGKKHVYGLINIPIILTYLLVNYDYVLIGCRYFLIPLVSLGTLSVVGFYITGKQRLPVFLQLYPVILVLITASIFKQEYITNTLYSLNVLTISYMIYLVIVFVNHFLWQKSKMNIIISHLLPFWFLASVFFGMNRYHHSTNVHMVLSYILSLPHFFYQDLVFCILLAGITIIIFHILKKLPRIRNISSIIIKIISFILIILIYVDYRTTSILGVRMTWSTFTSADDPAQALKLISHYMSITTVFSMIFLPFLFFSLNYGFSKKHILKTKSKYLLWLISAIVFLSPGYYFLGDFDYVYPNTIWNIASTSPITKILTDDTMSKEYFTSFSQKNNLFP
ncbi:hypothetical protein KAJ27_22860, partial [bacterium]|nr:hypothetical protein [bacterium]